MSHGQLCNEIRSVRKPANETSMATQKAQHPNSMHIPMPNLHWNMSYPCHHNELYTNMDTILPNLEQHSVHYFRQAISTTAQDTCLPTSNIHHSSGYLPSHGTRCSTFRGKTEACSSSHRNVTNSLTCSMRKFPPTFKIQISHKLWVGQRQLEIEASINVNRYGQTLHEP